MQNTISWFSFLKEYGTNDWLKMCYTVTHSFSVQTRTINGFENEKNIERKFKRLQILRMLIRTVGLFDISQTESSPMDCGLGSKSDCLIKHNMRSDSVHMSDSVQAFHETEYYSPSWKMTSPTNSCHRGCAMDGRAEGGNGRQSIKINTRVKWLFFSVSIASLRDNQTAQTQSAPNSV
ncbi:hypothetical protein LXL04_001141 [Taraxacum kok-saghyz]